MAYKNAIKFKMEHLKYDIKLIFEKKEFEKDAIDDYNPDYIMCPHWSWIILEEIFSKYKCIVYHVSDVPGSPVQNQIWDGYTRTCISAIKVDKNLAVYS